MAHPRTAVRGNRAGVLGMLLAIVATLLSEQFAACGFDALPVIAGVISARSSAPSPRCASR